MTTHIDIDVGEATVEARVDRAQLDVTAVPPSIQLMIPGTQGPAGQPGLVKVEHGADAGVARPDAPLVYWVGTVQPANADPDDLLMLKET